MYYSNSVFKNVKDHNPHKKTCLYLSILTFQREAAFNEMSHWFRRKKNLHMQNQRRRSACSNCTVDQHHCFRYSGSKIFLLHQNSIFRGCTDRFASDPVGKPKLLVLSCECPNDIKKHLLRNKLLVQMQ